MINMNSDGIRDHSPPRKRLCCEYSISDCLTPDELSRVLSLKWNRERLNILNKEIDSLDDFHSVDKKGTFTNHHQYEYGLPSFPSKLVCSAEQNLKLQHYVYISPFEKQNFEHIEDSSEIRIDKKRFKEDPEIVLDARREATVLQQVSQLRRQGLWSTNRLPRIMEPKSEKSHHAYFISELIWMAEDFKEELKWKKDVAYKLARSAQIYLMARQEWNKQIEAFEEHLKMKTAFRVAKMVENWWEGINQNLDAMNQFIYHRRWKRAYKKNQSSVADFSDLGPSWMAAVKYDFSDTININGSNGFTSCADDPLQIDSDGDTDDGEWKPGREAENSQESDSCSRSTSSSRAASFVDDEDASDFGISECSLFSDLSACANTSAMKSQVSVVANSQGEISCNNIVDSSENSAITRTLRQRSDISSHSNIQPTVDVHEKLSDSSELFVDNPISKQEDQCVDNYEVQALADDMQAPLKQILEPYIKEGWNTKNVISFKSALYSSDSELSDYDIDNLPMGTSEKLQTEITALKKEAELPLEQVLPPGYLNLFGSESVEKDDNSLLSLSPSYRNSRSCISPQSCTVTSPNTTVLSFCGGECESNTPEHDDTADIKSDLENSDVNDSEIVSAAKGDEISFIGSKQTCAFSSCPTSGVVRSIYYAPWSIPNSETSCRPADLYTMAMELLPLKLTSTDHPQLSQYLPELCTLAYGPTLRIRSLPTSNLGAAVTWLRHAFARSIPGLLLSNNQASGDAELAVAAHLGQLAIANPRCYLPSGLLSDGNPNSPITGEWGPHLIVAPRLCLPAWRSRLNTWCPGFRLTCLGSGGMYEPEGTGRYLRKNVTRGTVNICLVSYSALQSRPNRFSRIQWSTVIFDQIHHIITRLPGVMFGTQNQHDEFKKSKMPHDYAQSTVSSAEVSSSGDSTTECPLYHRVDSSMREKYVSAPFSGSNGCKYMNWLDLLINKIGRNSHRILISSSTELVHKHSSHLLDLGKLLLKGSSKSWVGNLFEAVNARRRFPCESNPKSKPTKKQLFKFLEPFIFRFEEDEEWEAYVDEDIVECHMTPLQLKLHDTILNTKAAENAIKTGNLLDFLQTVSAASRTCSHSCLSGTQPRSSKIFQQTLHSLESKIKPTFGPFVLRPLLQSKINSRQEYLTFSTPESVLLGIKLLKQSELTGVTRQFFNLASSLRSSAYIRNRIAKLVINNLPTSSKIVELTPTHPNITTNGIPSPVSPNNRVYNNITDNVRCNVSNGGGIIRTPVYNNHTKFGIDLSNGLPDPEHLPLLNHTEMSVDSDIESVSIPQRQKRRFTLNTVSCTVNKRRRVDESESGSNQDNSTHRNFNASLRSPTDSSHLGVPRVPFISQDLINFLAMEGIQNPKEDKNTFSEATHSLHLSVDNTSIPASHAGDEKNINENSYPCLKDNVRKCTQLIGFEDWCSFETSEMILNKMDSSKEYQSFSVLFSEENCELRNIASSYLNELSRFNLLFTKSSAVAVNPQLFLKYDDADCLIKNKHIGNDINHDIDIQTISNKLFQQLYPLTEQARWLSPAICSSGFCRYGMLDHSSESLFTPMGRLFTESGKFYHLHSLLNNLMGINHVIAGFEKRRPRCIYFVAHQAAFLDLLDAYLSASCWHNLTRIRIPFDYKSVGVRSGLLIDRINTWPQGSMGPLLVLIHARTPFSLLVSLRAGPDVSIIICDVDWRAEVTDNLRAIIHSWVLNGLVDFPDLSRKDSDHQKVRVYRLISGGFGCSVSQFSVEACLSRGVACRLLPRAVFHAHATTDAGRRSLLFARVQPNVVNGLLLGTHARKFNHRSLVYKPRYNEYDRLEFTDRGILATIKQEALSCSSASSIASSFSFAGLDNRIDEFEVEKTGEDDDVTLFQEREPLSECLLRRALELFEDPLDTQAWCCVNAEQAVIGNEFVSETLDSENSYVVDELLESSLGWFIEPIKLSDQNYDHSNSLKLELKNQLDYSDLVEWEVANYELRTQIDHLENQLNQPEDEFFTYHSSTNQINTLHSDRTLIDPSVDCLPLHPFITDLSVWEPLESHNQQPVLCDLVNDSSQNNSYFSPTHDFYDWTVNSLNSDWGYESTPMSENELPPLPTPIVSTVNHSDNQTLKRPLSSQNSPFSQNTIDITTNTANTNTNSRLSTSYRNNSRLSVSSSNIKRRKLVGAAAAAAAAASRRNAMYSHLMSSSVSTHNLPDNTDPNYNLGGVGQIVNDARIQDVRSLNSQVNSRTSTSSINVSSTCSPPGMTTNAPVGSTGTSGYTNNTIMLSLYTGNSSVGSVGSKLHIPRVSYNKEVTNARVHRLRRINTSTTCSSSDAVTAVALAAGAHLLQQQLSQSGSYHGGHGQQLANAVAAAAISPWSSFANPAILARYGHSNNFSSIGSNSPARHLSSIQNYFISNNSQFSSFKYNVGSTVSTTNTSGTNSTNSMNLAQAAANQLYAGKPPDWLIYEEAGLYQCISKLQELNFELNNSNSTPSSFSPNYRLAEFFLNNYLPTRSYRGARQCLLTHFKMQNIVSSANTVTSGSTNLLNFNNSLNSDESFHSISTSSASTPHGGPSSRKVKNKLKSAAAASVGLSGSSSQLSSSFGSGSTGAANHGAAAAVNRCRGYLLYQHLQSWCNLHNHSSTDSSQTNSSVDTVTTIPPYLSQVFHTIRSVEDNEASLLRKSIRDSLSAPVPINSIYRPSVPRRSGMSSGIISASSNSTVATYHSNLHSGAGGISGGHFGHHGHGTSGSVPLTHGQSAHSSTSAALLTHYRHRHHPSYDHAQSQQIQSPSTAESSGSMTSLSSTGPATTIVHSGPMIQKNPTHIAALQEHNINPDTLITPAMVIKNKEEREARLRAEALSAANQSSISSSSSSMSSSVNINPGPSSFSTTINTTDTNATHHNENTSIYSHNSHLQENAYKQSTLFPNPNSSSIELTTSYLPNTGIMSPTSVTSNRVGPQLSFAHSVSHRGTGVVLPIRPGFGTSTLASTGTILSFTGQQSQQRLLGSQNASSPPPGGHFQYQPRQTLLHSSIGRLTHLTSNNGVTYTSATHMIPSAAITSNTDEESCRNLDLNSGTILIPGSWRATSNPRSLNVQTIVTSTSTMLRRSATFTGLGVPNPGSAGLQTCRLNTSQNPQVNSISGNYLGTQITKSSSSNLFLHQRPQFLSSSTRHILTPSSNVSVVSSVVTSHTPSMAHLPQILRPRNTLRGSVVQPAFVRTISAVSNPVVSVSANQVGSRLSPGTTSNVLHGRVTLTVSSNNPSVPNILASRGTLHASSALFQSPRTTGTIENESHSIHNIGPNIDRSSGSDV